VAGWLRVFNKKKTKRSQIWPTEIRIPVSAKTPIRELCTTPSRRGRTHARVVRPTGILKESLLDLPSARAREESADFTAWRVKTFGGNFEFRVNPKPITLLVNGGLCDEKAARGYDV